MRKKLEQYVDLLFAGAENCEDIRQEILQNTLDRYDDLIAEGKVPEAAYRLAITGIGDIHEILGMQQPTFPQTQPQRKTAEEEESRKRLMRAIAVGLYILCPIPLITLSSIGNNVMGLCGVLCFVAAATVLMILYGKKEDDDKQEKTPEQKLHNALWLACSVLYLIISFTTQAWFITWLLFPICAALIQLLKAIKAYKEADENES